MALADQIQEFLQRLTPLTRGSLLTELERLEVCGAEIPALRRSWRNCAPNSAPMDRIKIAPAILRDSFSLRWSRC